MRVNPTLSRRKRRSKNTCWHSKESKSPSSTSTLVKSPRKATCSQRTKAKRQPHRIQLQRQPQQDQAVALSTYLASNTTATELTYRLFDLTSFKYNSNGIKPLFYCLKDL